MKSKLFNLVQKKIKNSTMLQFSVISFIVVLLLSGAMMLFMTTVFNRHFDIVESISKSGNVVDQYRLSKEQVLTGFIAFCLVLYGFLFIVFRFAFKRMNRINQHLNKAKEVTLYALATLAETRDVETGKHLERTSQYVAIIAKELQKLPQYKSYLTSEYIEDLVKSAPLHDIGKVGIRDSILLKPGKLTDEEFEQMKEHCAIGSDTLREASDKLDFQSFLSIAIQLSRFHHEKWDGKGYPEGLNGENIPISARIMALADVYDALRSTRPYKEAMTHQRAREIIVSESGRHFDPDVVNAFIKNEMSFINISRKIT